MAKPSTSMPRPCVPIKTHRARQKKGAQQVGHSRSGASTKVHAVVDALGNPVRLKLTEGQAHEMTVALELVADGRRRELLLHPGGPEHPEALAARARYTYRGWLVVNLEDVDSAPFLAAAAWPARQRALAILAAQARA